MPKKKLEDLTLREVEMICAKYNPCFKCPLYVEFGKDNEEKCFKAITNIYKWERIPDELKKKEIEVEE